MTTCSSGTPPRESMELSSHGGRGGRRAIGGSMRTMTWLTRTQPGAAARYSRCTASDQIARPPTRARIRTTSRTKGRGVRRSTLRRASSRSRGSARQLSRCCCDGLLPTAEAADVRPARCVFCCRRFPVLSGRPGSVADVMLHEGLQQPRPRPAMPGKPRAGPHLDLVQSSSRYANRGCPKRLPAPAAVDRLRARVTMAGVLPIAPHRDATVLCDPLLHRDERSSAADAGWSSRACRHDAQSVEG